MCRDPELERYLHPTRPCYRRSEDRVRRVNRPTHNLAHERLRIFFARVPSATTACHIRRRTGAEGAGDLDGGATLHSTHRARWRRRDFCPRAFAGRRLPRS